MLENYKRARSLLRYISLEQKNKEKSIDKREQIWYSIGRKMAELLKGKDLLFIFNKTSSFDLLIFTKG